MDSKKTGTRLCLPFTLRPDASYYPKKIAAAAVYWLADESGPVSGQVVDLEQYPFIGRRNPPKDTSTIPHAKL